MDNYFEHLVPRPLPLMNKLLIALIVAGALVILAAAFLFIPGFWLIIAAAVGYGAFFLIRMQFLEYEYIVTNEEIDIDRITARARRRRLITFRFKDVSEMGPCTDDAFRRAAEKKDYAFKLDASSQTDINAAYYILLTHKDKGKCFLVIEPNEELLKIAKRANPRCVTIRP